MSEQYFWGLTLEGGATSSGAWDPENEGGDKQAAFQGDQSLIIKQAVLGGKAKPGEVNIVQVEAMGFSGTVKIPIVRLAAGEMSQCRLELTFPDPPVTFSLLEGNGPVHLVGNIAIGDGGQGVSDEMDEEMDDEEEDENLEEEEVNDIQNSKADIKKRKGPFTVAGNMKKAKLEVPHDVEDDEDEGEDPKKKKGASAKKEKPKKK